MEAAEEQPKKPFKLDKKELFAYLATFVVGYLIGTTTVGRIVMTLVSFLGGMFIGGFVYHQYLKKKFYKDAKFTVTQ